MKLVHLFRGTTGILALLGLFALAGPNRADILIFKDGFTLTGKVKREGQVIFEGGQAIKVGNGSFVIDDDQTLPESRSSLVKRTLFTSRQVQDVDDKVVGKEPQIIALKTSLTPFSTASRMEPFGPILKVTPWDTKWERTYEIQPLKQEAIATKQRIVLLTPHAVWVESSRFLWQQMYLTTELGPDVVRQLLYSHPDLKERPGQADPVKREKLVRFLRQAGFYDTAEQELEQWVKDDPTAKDKVAAERTLLNQLRASELADQIDRAFKVGQHQWVQKHLQNFPKEATDRQQARMLTIKDAYEKGEESLTAARRFLKELPPKAFPEAHKQIFTEAAQAILRELNNDNYQRLETFVTFAKQAERDQKQGRTPMHTPSDLLALAVSGWVLGNGSAEAKAEAGIRLWRARQFIQEYQRTDAVGLRQRLLNGYTRDATETVAFDELAQIITNLPPSHPEAKLPAGPIPLTTDLPMGLRKSVNYIVQLPREYHHGRPYPVLFVLHQAIEKAADTMDRWSDLAHQNGYILVAPEWPARGQLKESKYHFSPDEHAAVLDTLRDMQRRFNVDTDRVFMAGVGQGGDMAMDVGLSHPDVFAGVVAMGVQPRYFTKAYANNAQYLPMYIVSGELASESPKAIRQVFLNSFIARGMPALYVEYKGRGNEWFTGELPTIFDWMNRKKRAMANPEMTEMSSMRPGDNRFYWLSGEGINPTSVNDLDKWRSLAVPATLQGRIAESNTIRIYAKNWKTITLWFTRGMIEFDKPVSIWIGTELRMKDKKISPSLATLLEDFYLRGDRSRLFLQKLELPLTNR